MVIPDTLALATFYKDWLGIGGGLSKISVLAYGGIPDIANDFSDKSLLSPRGAIINGNFEEVFPVDLVNLEEIQETVNHSWYKAYPQGKVGLHPYEGITDPHYAPGPNIKGTPTDLKQVDEQDRYSWLKTPLWRGNQMEVGPLARMLVGYAKKDDAVRGIVDDFCGRLGAPVSVLQSTLGRIAARSLELAGLRKNFATSMIAWSPTSRTATAPQPIPRTGVPTPGRKARCAAWALQKLRAELLAIGW